jgi:hypothetical protein
VIPFNSGKHFTKSVSGVIGLAKKSDELIGISFDILSLEALFLVPR